MTPRSILKQENFKYKFSICTLVTNTTEYQEMINSFVQAGFIETDCEYLYADNSNGNNFEAYGGINRFLREALGEFVIICHQDVVVNFDNRLKLEQEIENITGIDPCWGVLGNAGVNNPYNISMKITHGDLTTSHTGVLPSKVQSLDENFILIKASANLAVAGDLQGFHMYGTDICLVAECLGYRSYVIDFHLLHKGYGTIDNSFHELSRKLADKYSRFFRGRYIRSTITRFYISSNAFVNALMNIGFIKSIGRFCYKARYKFTGKV